MTPHQIATTYSGFLMVLANATAAEDQLGPGRTVPLRLDREVVRVLVRALAEGIRIIDREAPVLEPAPGD